MSHPFGFLLTDTARLLRRRFDERARAHGTTRAQWRALLAISRREGVNQGALADLLEVEPITLCRMIDRIAEAGLVERRRDPGDRRAWQLFLTPKARPVIDELRAVADEMTEQALAGIADEARAALATTLDRIRTNLTDLPTRSEAAHG